MTQAPDFTKMVPGFDFLQNLVKNAGSALPSVGQWVAPTLDPQEIEKRIGDLRTVQYWLEQNARMLGTTIQALEVQRMTLSTLQTMNVQMEDLRESLQVRTAVGDSGSAAAPVTSGDKKSSKTDARGAGAPSGAVDPMQWWGALTEQFNQLAVTAMKDSAAAGQSAMAAAGQALPTTAAGSSKAAAKSAGKKTTPRARSRPKP